MIGGAILIYNTLARLRLLADGAWADIDVQLKRRHDLVPSLVAAVEGHAGYERATLESIVTARGSAVTASGPRASGAAEQDLEASLHRFIAVAEAYPDLKATDSFLKLQHQLTDIEDHIQQARRYYNAVVRDLNTKRSQFPARLVASAFGIGPREFFGLEDPDEAQPPTVELEGSA